MSAYLRPVPHVDGIGAVAYLDGEIIPTPTGGTIWRCEGDAARAIRKEIVTYYGPVVLRWEPQYDSTVNEALGEPCGWVGVACTPG